VTSWLFDDYSLSPERRYAPDEFVLAFVDQHSAVITTPHNLSGFHPAFSFNSNIVVPKPAEITKTTWKDMAKLICDRSIDVHPVRQSACVGQIPFHAAMGGIIVNNDMDTSPELSGPQESLQNSDVQEPTQNPDELVGEFWEMIERREEVMPGAWID
jgi:hypothetical protein